MLSQPAGHKPAGASFVGDRRTRLPRIQVSISTLILAAVLSGVILVGVSAMAVEEPVYKTELKDGAFEIRDYPALVVAEVDVSGKQRSAASDGFRLLAGYIFGGNTRKQSIAMTAPVAQQPTGETIATAAPATTIKTASEWVVRFTMPTGYTLATLPQPDDAKVRLRETPPAHVAIIRFSGLARPGDVAAKTADLTTWIRTRHLRDDGPPSLAQYNPPWTLWFLRRNEIMIPVQR